MIRPGVDRIIPPASELTAGFASPPARSSLCAIGIAMNTAPRRSANSPVLIIVTAVLVGVLSLVGILGWKWYSYVTAGASPYDEIGIEVNTRLPGPLREWGCARIKERFPRSVPPYGCEPGQR